SPWLRFCSTVGSTPLAGYTPSPLMGRGQAEGNGFWSRDPRFESWRPSHRQPVMPTRLAAVVMAGGLGTRMRSGLAKHLHPLLGRRMVDWVVAAATPLAPDPLVIVASPET